MRLAKTTWFPFAILLLLGAVVFGQTLRFEFLNLDDDFYVTKNSFRALWGTWEGIRHAFFFTETGNWHPLVWLSLMVDHALYGLNPAGYHFTNVLLHLSTGCLLFVLLNSWTGSPWRSFFVTAFFLVHPQRAESVAWIAERKDVLSGLFFMLTLWGYTQYVSCRGTARRAPTVKWYFITLSFFALGLMSKSMLVTLPFLLLLLDFWPLGRWNYQKPVASDQRKNRKTNPVTGLWFLILEKIPFFILILLSCFMAVAVRTDVALYINDEVPLVRRVLNSFVFYIAYLRDFFIPSRLTFFRPYPLEGIPAFQIISSVGIMLVISLAAFLGRRRKPFLFTGWFWFVGMLVPVIGLIQIGSSAYADRYTYLPSIGLWIAIVWGVCDESRTSRAIWVRRCGGVLLIIYAFLSWRQTALWENNQTLYNYALKLNPHNFLARINLGLQLKKTGDYEKAIEQFEAAHKIRPGDIEPLFYQASAHYQKGNIAKALRGLEVVLVKDEDFALAHELLAEIKIDQGDRQSAEEHYAKLITSDPKNAQAHYNYGNLWYQQNDLAKAEMHFREAYVLDPTYVKAANNLANILAMSGKLEEAVSLYQAVVEIAPERKSTYKNLVVVLRELGREQEAKSYESYL